MRFRHNTNAVLGDIESIFYQVKVQTNNRDCLRFYWWKDGNIDENPTEYRMTVHLFGATSSLSCCNYALQYTAEKFKDEFDTKVTDAVTKIMYVEDCSSSVDEVEKAVSLIKDVTKL